MSFLISKAIGFLLLPSNLIALVGVLGLIGLLIGWRRSGRLLMAISIVALVLAGWSPAGPLALKSLEDRFPPPRIEGPVSGIVMLGGAVDVHITKDRGSPALTDAGERVTAVAVLARQYPDARIILSGGASDIGNSGAATESAVAKDLLVAMGLPADRIELEERSRNTCENAEESAVVAQPESGETWLLVTSASHMPRSVGCFRAAGFQVIPYPVDYRTRDVPWEVLSIATGLEMLDLAAHEWIGLASYRALGRTAELFPAP
jgi:uncharacterized SAM-binding protein YcdF (DUF218 family)